MQRHRIIIVVMVLASVLGGAAWAANSLLDRQGQEVLMGPQLTLTPEMEEWLDAIKDEAGVWVKTFGQYRLVVITMGEMPSAGYAVQIVDLDESTDAKWVIDITFTAPGADDMVATVITYPYAVIAIKAGDTPIVVRDVSGAEPVELPFVTAK